MLCALAAAFAVPVATGCSHRLGDFSVLSNRNVSVKMDKGQRVKGRDCVWNILGVQLGNPNLEAAADDAMESSSSAEMLVDASIVASSWWFLIGQQCLTVRGTLARPAASSAQQSVTSHGANK
jgi:hypothetical protein